MIAEQTFDHRRIAAGRSGIASCTQTLVCRLVVLASLLPLCGCHLVYRERSSPISNAMRTVIREPHSFPLHKNDYLARIKNRWLARRAWVDVVSACPDQAYSSSYAHGFKDGFSDYLYAGGSGEPPPVPPRRYWKVGCETPAGRAAIDDWFAGFRHGSAVCRQQGYRDLVVIPSSVYEPPADIVTASELSETMLVPDPGNEPSLIDSPELPQPLVPILTEPLGKVEQETGTVRLASFDESAADTDVAEPLTQKSTPAAANRSTVDEEPLHVLGERQMRQCPPQTNHASVCEKVGSSGLGRDRDDCRDQVTNGGFDGPYAAATASGLPLRGGVDPVLVNSQLPPALISAHAHLISAQSRQRGFRPRPQLNREVDDSRRVPDVAFGTPNGSAVANALHPPPTKKDRETKQPTPPVLCQHLVFRLGKGGNSELCEAPEGRPIRQLTPDASTQTSGVDNPLVSVAWK